MSVHSYSRCWLHLIWATQNRERMLFGEAATKHQTFCLSMLNQKTSTCERIMLIRSMCTRLIDLPTNYSIEEVLKLLKGASSHWINQNRLVKGKFFWGRGYGVFSVSQSNVDAVGRYISTQEAHHRKKSFLEEYGSLVKRYGLQWVEEETVETVEGKSSKALTPR